MMVELGKRTLVTEDKCMLQIASLTLFELLEKFRDFDKEEELVLTEG